MASDDEKNSGCWTCQLRSSRCDNARPICLTCRRYHLPCEGYALKPEWMDGSNRERQYLKNIEAIIQDNVGSKRSGRWRKVRNEPSETISSSQDARYSHQVNTTPGLNKDGSSPTDYSSPDLYRLETQDTRDGVEIATGAATSADNSTTDTVVDVSCYAFPDDAPNTAHSSSQPRQLLSSGNRLQPSPPAITDGECLLSISQSVVQSLCFCESFSCRQCLKQSDLFVRYMSQAFINQFPLYSRSLTYDRGWIYILYRHSTLFQYSLLSLGAYSMQRSTYPSTYMFNAPSENSMIAAHYNIKSLQLLREKLSRVHDSERFDDKIIKIEIIASIMQLLFFEILQGHAQQWSMHMHAASTLLTSLLKCSSVQILDQDAEWERNVFRCESQTKALMPFHRTATAFLGSVFGWFDIISSTLLRTTPHFSDHKLLLGTNGASDSTTVSPFGCQDWVALAIARINNLDAWKTSKTLNNSLSIIELASRASDLKQFITARTSDRAEQVAENALQGSCSELQAMIMTNIFALAALILLDVVVSGAHTNIPEIRQNVDRSVRYLRMLPPSELSIWTAWPVCIIGSMASEESHDFFEELIATIDQPNLHYLAMVRILDVMQECWRLRAQGHSNVDWTSAIRSLYPSVCPV